MRAWLAVVFLVACGAPMEPGEDAGTCSTGACTEPDTVCVMGASGPTCECREGTMRDEAGRCSEPQRCEATTCHDHGECSEEGGLHCTCATTFGGPLCERCADGLHDDGVGGCTDDACMPNPCTGERRCVPMGGEPTCACPAGMHDQDGACVPDTTCMPTTCNGRGECTEDPMPRCTCDAGWTGVFCDACDAASGYHDDGAGGCTMDPCMPNPCTDPNRTVCMPDSSCACDAGYHLEGPGCIVDEVCDDTTCSAHGGCDLTGGRTVCTCDDGYEGDACELCAAGFHDDGAGGCTDDACTPNPCAAIANRTVCSVDAGGLAACACEGGYHDDGVGGCTTDPCAPDPCVAMGMACRNTGGTAECYTPACNDMNPCTDDRVVGGRCVYNPLPDGSACSTTLCQSGQTCMGSVCGGGSAVSCDDARPCTADSCDPVRGCLHTNDDAIVPDDGRACTIDACASGVERHTASDPICDDARYCTGVERCMPSSASADMRGCVATSVPIAPGPDAQCGRYVCNDAMMRFDFTPVSSGTSCEDGIFCTTADVCDGSGACRGTVSTDCGSAAVCSSTTPWSGVIDVSPARVRGNIRYAGSSTFPQTAEYVDVDLFLRAQDTGVLHFIERVDFSSTWSGTGYPATVFGPSSDRVIDLPMMPGVYDVVYIRGSSVSDQWTFDHYPTDNYAWGHRVLRENVVIGPGSNTLDIDVAPARITGSLRYAGSTVFPQTSEYVDVDLFLRAHDTGVLHFIERVDFSSTWSGTGYPAAVYGPSSDRTIDLPILPGTYDIVYIRGSSVSDAWTFDHYPTDNYAWGHRVLRENVVIGPGTTSLDIDVAPARITGSLRYAGSTVFPQTSEYVDVDLFLRAHDTGVLHFIERVDFSSTWSGTGYPAAVYGPSSDRTIDLPILPGTYDIVYIRGSSVSDAWTFDHYPTDNYAWGHRVLRENVVIGPGTTALDIDVAPARITGNLRYAGSSTFPQTAEYVDIDLFLRARDTGVLHFIERVDFSSTWSGTGYPPAVYGPSSDRVIDMPMLPGAYDIVYIRGSSVSDPWTFDHYPTDNYAWGHRVLRENVIVGPGTTNIDIDVAPARITGNLRYAGSSTFPQTAEYVDIDLFLRARDTGVLHFIERVDFSSTWSGTGYPPAVYGPSSDRVIDMPMLPGAYDIVYIRGSSVSDAWTFDHYPTDNYAWGHRVLRENVIVGPGTTNIDIDVAPARIAGGLRYAGGTVFPQTSEYVDVDLFLRARDTGVLHFIERVDFSSTWSGTGYPPAVYGPSSDRMIDLPMLPGQYDVVYIRGTSVSDAWTFDHYPTDNYFWGYRRLGICLDISR